MDFQATLLTLNTHHQPAKPKAFSEEQPSYIHKSNVKRHAFRLIWYGLSGISYKYDALRRKAATLMSPSSLNANSSSIIVKQHAFRHSDLLFGLPRIRATKVCTALGEWVGLRLLVSRLLASFGCRQGHTIVYRPFLECAVWMLASTTPRQCPPC